MLTLMAKAKTAKIVRTLIDKLAEIDGSITLCDCDDYSELRGDGPPDKGLRGVHRMVP